MQRDRHHARRLLGFAVEPVELARQHLSDITGYALRTSSDLVEATTDVGCFLELSGALKKCAMKLSKICNDLRLLSSGPQAGFGEITLPPRQAGSYVPLHTPCRFAG